MLHNLDESNRITWASHIKNLLFRFGFGYVWISQDVGDETYFMYVFKQRILDNALQDWNTDLNESRKAFHYKHFKIILNVEKYLTTKIPLKYKIAFSKLRCSNHSLLVETGRHHNILFVDRKCFLCNLQEIEDEFHAVIRCPFYNNIRNQYLNNFLGNNKQIRLYNVQDFDRLMSTEDSDKLLKLTTFTYEMFTKRNNYLQQQIEI